MNWIIEPLAKKHNRNNFDCGQESLTDFLCKFAVQNARKNISRTFVLTAHNSVDIAGYYSLCSQSISFDSMPENFSNKLPRYPIPAAHIGRLAVDKNHQGQGLGAMLLADAIKRICTISEQIGINAVTVHALNQTAREFYKAFGFIPFKDDQFHLFLPLKTIKSF